MAKDHAKALKEIEEAGYAIDQTHSQPTKKNKNKASKDAHNATHRVVRTSKTQITEKGNK